MHLIDESLGISLCGEEGPTSYNIKKVDCRECHIQIRLQRQITKAIAAAQEEAFQRLRKQKERIRKAEQRKRERGK